MFDRLRFWLVRRFLARLKTPRDVARMAFRRYAHRVAAVDARRSVTFAVLGQRTFRMASAWRALGLAPGNVVVVRLPDSVCQLEARLAAAECGAVITMISMWTPLEQLKVNLPLIEPRMLVHDGSDPAMARALGEMFPDMVQLVLHDGDSDWLAKGNDRPCAGDIDPQVNMSLGFSSGTTGTPKIITATFGVYLTSIRMVFAHTGMGVSRGAPEVMQSCIPLTGAGSGMVLPALLGGVTLLIPQRYEAQCLLDNIEQHRVTRLFITPSLLIDLLDHPSLPQRDLSSLTNIIYGTESTPAAKVEEAIRRFGPILQQGYGSAEVLPPVSMLQPRDHMVNGQPAPRHILMSCGRVVPSVTVRIVDEAGHDVASGVPGEVLVNSPTLFRGYWKRPDLNSENLRNGFLHIGDMGQLSADGYLTTLGRKPDLLHRDGRVIYPRRVEEVLHEHPAIKEANYVQGPRGLVMAYSLRQARRGVQADEQWASELGEFLRTRVPPQNLPDSYHRFDELPRSPLGKVLRRGVREHLASLAAGS